MSGDRVDANPVEIRRLAAALARYQVEVAEASRKVQGALRNATWQDRQKDRFEQRFGAVQQSTNRFLSSEVSEMVKTLNGLAARLEAIQQMRM